MPSRSLLPVVLSLSSLLLSLNVYLSAAPSLSARLAPRPWPASSPSVEFSRCMARPPARRAPYLSMAGRSYPFPWPRAVLCSFQAAPSHLLFSLPRSRHSSPPRPTPSVSLARRLSSLLLPPFLLASSTEQLPCFSPSLLGLCSSGDVESAHVPRALAAAPCRAPLRAARPSYGRFGTYCRPSGVVSSGDSRLKILPYATISLP